MTLPTHWRRRAVWLVVGVLLIGGVVWYVTPPPGPRITPGVQTTRVLGPVDAEGYVDFLAALNEHLGKDVSPEDNAAIPLLYALGPNDGDVTHVNLVLAALGQPPWQPGGLDFVTAHEFLRSRPGFDQRNEEYETQIEPAILRPWKDAEFPLASALLVKNDAALEAIQTALLRPKNFRPFVRRNPEDLLMDILRPNVQESRDIAWQLRMRAMRNLAENQLDLARDDLLAIHRLAAHVSNGGTLIELLIGYGIEAIGLETANHWGLHPDQSVASIDEYNALRSRIGPLASAGQKIDIPERCSALDTTQGVARGWVTDQSSNSPAFAPATQALADMVINWNVTAETVNVFFDDVQSLVSLSHSERLRQFGEFRTNFSSQSKQRQSVWENLKSSWGASHSPARNIAYVYIQLMIPGIEKAFDSQDRSAQRQKLFTVFLAAVQYRLEHGRYPDTLDALVPRWLPEVPTDVYSDLPVMYRRISDTEMRVYSVGENGIDDGGEPYDLRKGYDDITFSDPPQR